MDFGEQIKSIRKKENLTQEQFAIKLNVTRQAVSAKLYSVPKKDD